MELMKTRTEINELENGKKKEKNSQSGSNQ